MRSSAVTVVILSSVLAGSGLAQTKQDQTRPGPTGVHHERAKLTASDGAEGDSFGAHVTLSGDTLVVSAPLGGNDNQGGAVYVFRRVRRGWTEEAKLTASDGAVGDDFGGSVAVSGDTVIVGAPYARVAANLWQGAAYVFRRTKDGWTEVAKLTATDGAEGDHFGGSVAVLGKMVVVGAPEADVGANRGQGATHLFREDGGTWTEVAKLTAADGATADRFGASLAVACDTLVAGAPGAIPAGTTANQGAAYVFTRRGDAWTETGKLSASDWIPLVGGLFGTSLAFAGDMLMVGAPDATAGYLAQGAVYVFARERDGWTEMPRLVASDGAGFDALGSSVATWGDTVVAGAPEAHHPDPHGAVYVSSRTGDGWMEIATLATSDGAPLDFLGSSVAVAGDTVVAGAPSADVGGNSSQGAVYVFARPLAH